MGTSQSRDLETSYDVVLCGGGTAGCLIARRLSDEGKLKVLMIEAGYDHDGDAEIRNASQVYTLMSNYPSLFWNGPDDHSIPQKFVKNKVFQFTGGKCLAGGSSINGEQFVISSRDVIDKYWAPLGSQWSYEAIRAQFDRLVNYNSSSVQDSKLSIRAAPIEPSDVAVSFAKAMSIETKQPMIDRYNDPDTPVGTFSRWDLYQRKNSDRTNASNTFLPESYINIPSGAKIATSNNGRLTILFGATVNKILFDIGKGSVVARGVQFNWDGADREVTATQTVIVTAGIHTPKLLLQSGIGPRRDLQAAGIPVIVDSQHVGKHLANHLFVTLLCTGPTPQLTTDDLNALYLGGGFLPDPRPGFFGVTSTSRAYEIIGIPGPQTNSFLLGISPVQPLSRGTISLQKDGSTSVDFGYLSNADDTDSLRAMVRTMNRVAQRMGLQIPDLTPDILKSDAKLTDYIIDHIDQTHHWASSVRMSTSSRDGVLDSNCKVFGTSNLYVADVQGAPHVNDGNTSSIAYLIANTMCDQMLMTRGLKTERRPKDTSTLNITVVPKTESSPYFGRGNPMTFAINGVASEILELKRGQTYQVNYQSSIGCAHPFYWSTSESGQGDGMIDYPGFPLCSGKSTSVTFDSRFPDKFYFQCQVHEYMGFNVILS